MTANEIKAVCSSTETIRKMVGGKERWGMVFPTPGNDSACVWPYFVNLICRLGYYVCNAQDQQRMIWINTQDKRAIVMFEDKVACDELAAMLNEYDLWHLAQQECSAFYATIQACAQVHMSLGK